MPAKWKERREFHTGFGSGSILCFRATPQLNPRYSFFLGGGAAATSRQKQNNFRPKTKDVCGFARVGGFVVWTLLMHVMTTCSDEANLGNTSHDHIICSLLLAPKKISLNE